MKVKHEGKCILTLMVVGMAAVTMLTACGSSVPQSAVQTSVIEDMQTAESAETVQEEALPAPTAMAIPDPTPVPTPDPTPVPEELVLKGSAEATVGSGIQLCPLTVDGVDVDTASLTWQSSDESVAIVTNGWIDALRPGCVTITVTGTGYLPVTHEVTVRQITCTYCGQAGHTADSCAQKAANEQAARAAAQAAAQAAESQTQVASEEPTPEEAVSETAEAPAAPEEGICPVCGSQLNPDGSCNVIHEYAGYAMAYYDETIGQVYIICNGCGQRFWRSDFSDPREFALSHGYPCCSRFDAGGGM